MKKTDGNKSYKLTRSAAPPAFVLNSKNSKRKPLMHFDKKSKTNRILRYATNQKSPFVDEQDDNFILGSIIFEDGMLTVPETNPVLQHFLEVHPSNGIKFVEMDNEKDASIQMKEMDLEDEARDKAGALDIDMAEIVFSVIWASKDVNSLSSSELKRDLRVYARNNPNKFLETLNNPKLELFGKIQKFYSEGILSLRSAGKEVWMNTAEKKRMLIVPKNQAWMEVVAEYLISKEGEKVYDMLENYMTEEK